MHCENTGEFLLPGLVYDVTKHSNCIIIAHVLKIDVVHLQVTPKQKNPLIIFSFD